MAFSNIRDTILAQSDTPLQVLELAPIGVMLFSAPGGEIVYANPTATRIVGQPLEGPAPMRAHPDLYGLRRPDGKPIPLEELPSWKALHGQVVTNEEVILTRPDRAPTTLSVSAAPLRRGDEIQGAVTYFQDISDHKELDRMREEHVAVVAHDLINPIQVLLLGLQAMLIRQEGGTTRVGVDQIEGMQRTLERLAGLIKHFSDAALIGSNRVPLNLRPMALPPAVSALVESIRPSFGEHQVKLEVTGEPPSILGDALRIEQIATNLLENACKYSNPGTDIVVEVRPEDNGALLTVSDQGPGVAPEDLPWLFDRFYQAKRSRERKSGLGLGLYITRGLVEAHRGRVWVNSTPGKGSAFQVWFPPAPP